MTKILETENYFLICPRDFLTKNIWLTSEAIAALNTAEKTLNENSHGRYKLVLTRGYVSWNIWRKLRAFFAKLIFFCLYWNDRSSAESLFGHNGHNDGLSVDVLLYDVVLNKKIHWLSWRNIMISRRQAEKIIEKNKTIINMIDGAMSSAGFFSHSDPREKLQMHYRLNLDTSDKNAVTGRLFSLTIA